MEDALTVVRRYQAELPLAAMKQNLLKQFLPLGAPQLRAVATRVGCVDTPSFRADAERLRATLRAFRSEFVFGRAVAAPQIGIDVRFIALELANAPSLIVDPEIVWRSEDTFTMWDDCMSFRTFLSASLGGGPSRLFSP